MNTLRNALLAGLGSHLIAAMAISNGDTEEKVILNRIMAEIDDPGLVKLMKASFKLGYYVNPQLNGAIVVLLIDNSEIDIKMIHVLANSGEHVLCGSYQEVWDKFAELLPADKQLVLDASRKVENICLAA